MNLHTIIPHFSLESSHVSSFFLHLDTESISLLPIQDPFVLLIAVELHMLLWLLPSTYSLPFHENSGTKSGLLPFGRTAEESKSFAYTIPPRKLILDLGEPREYQTKSTTPGILVPLSNPGTTRASTDPPIRMCRRT